MKQALWVALALLGGCQSEDATIGVTAPGDAQDATAYAGIAEDVVLRFTGTEPFWGGTVTGSTLTWSTPENLGGETVTVSRFAGNGGLGFSGTISGQQFDMTVTPGDCSDGMSDRTYPFSTTVRLGAQQLSGCAWRDTDDLGPPP